MKKISTLLQVIYNWYITNIVLRGHCGYGCQFHFPVSIYNPAKLTLGDNVKIGPFVTIICGDYVDIQSNVLVASNTVITSSGHELDPKLRKLTTNKPILIEYNVWIGASCVILPGTTICSDSVIAAGSVVSKRVESESILIQKRNTSISIIR